LGQEEAREVGVRQQDGRDTFASTVLATGHGRGEGEEGRRPRVLKDVKGVSKKGREEHEATHTPFRPWCKHCAREGQE